MIRGAHKQIVSQKKNIIQGRHEHNWFAQPFWGQIGDSLVEIQENAAYINKIPSTPHYYIQLRPENNSRTKSSLA